MLSESENNTIIQQVLVHTPSEKLVNYMAEWWVELLDLGARAYHHMSSYKKANRHMLSTPLMSSRPIIKFDLSYISDSHDVYNRFPTSMTMLFPHNNAMLPRLVFAK